MAKASCKQCGDAVNNRYAVYCSNKCQNDFQYESYIKRWKQVNEDGSRGILAKNISGHIRRYLYEKYKDGCSICKWNEVNLITGRIPIEIDHIDGDSENNVESNLRMICPNCHSLTTSFRNLNKGNGRMWRRLKYKKV